MGSRCDRTIAGVVLAVLVAPIAARASDLSYASETACRSNWTLGAESNARVDVTNASQHDVSPSSERFYPGETLRIRWTDTQQTVDANRHHYKQEECWAKPFGVGLFCKDVPRTRPNPQQISALPIALELSGPGGGVRPIESPSPTRLNQFSVSSPEHKAILASYETVDVFAIPYDPREGVDSAFALKGKIADRFPASPGTAGATYDRRKCTNRPKYCSVGTFQFQVDVALDGRARVIEQWLATAPRDISDINSPSVLGTGSRLWGANPSCKLRLTNALLQHTREKLPDSADALPIYDHAKSMANEVFRGGSPGVRNEARLLLQEIEFAKGATYSRLGNVGKALELFKEGNQELIQQLQVALSTPGQMTALDYQKLRLLSEGTLDSVDSYQANRVKFDVDDIVSGLAALDAALELHRRTLNNERVSNTQLRTMRNDIASMLSARSEMLRLVRTPDALRQSVDANLDAALISPKVVRGRIDQVSPSLNIAILDTVRKVELEVDDTRSKRVAMLDAGRGSQLDSPLVYVATTSPRAVSAYALNRKVWSVRPPASPAPILSLSDGEELVDLAVEPFAAEDQGTSFLALVSSPSSDYQIACISESGNRPTTSWPLVLGGSHSGEGQPTSNASETRAYALGLLGTPQPAEGELCSGLADLEEFLLVGTSSGIQQVLVDESADMSAERLRLEPTNLVNGSYFDLIAERLAIDRADESKTGRAATDQVARHEGIVVTAGLAVSEVQEADASEQLAWRFYSAEIASGKWTFSELQECHVETGMSADEYGGFRDLAYFSAEDGSFWSVGSTDDHYRIDRKLLTGLDEGKVACQSLPSLRLRERYDSPPAIRPLAAGEIAVIPRDGALSKIYTIGSNRTSRDVAETRVGVLRLESERTLVLSGTGPGDPNDLYLLTSNPPTEKQIAGTGDFQVIDNKIPGLSGGTTFFGGKYVMTAGGRVLGFEETSGVGSARYFEMCEVRRWPGISEVLPGRKGSFALLEEDGQESRQFIRLFPRESSSSAGGIRSVLPEDSGLTWCPLRTWRGDGRDPVDYEYDLVLTAKKSCNDSGPSPAGTQRFIVYSEFSPQGQRLFEVELQEGDTLLGYDPLGGVFVERGEYRYSLAFVEANSSREFSSGNLVPSDSVVELPKGRLIVSMDGKRFVREYEGQLTAGVREGRKFLVATATSVSKFADQDNGWELVGADPDIEMIGAPSVSRYFVYRLSAEEESVSVTEVTQDWAAPLRPKVGPVRLLGEGLVVLPYERESDKLDVYSAVWPITATGLLESTGPRVVSSGEEIPECPADFNTVGLNRLARVAAERGLNLRSSPESNGSENIIATLPNGATVSVLEGNDSDFWARVSVARTDGKGFDIGYVARRFLIIED